MPLPPALLAKLMKRGIIDHTNINTIEQQIEKDNAKEDEEIIAENYDEEENKREPYQVVSEGTQHSSNDNDDLKSHLEAKFKGYQGCPNKYNVWHECTLFCKEYWGEGKKKPSKKYFHCKKKMLEKYPLPENWIEVYDRGCGRCYYWDVDNDVVSWLPPAHPKALITDSAAHFREERHLVETDRLSEEEKNDSDNSDSESSDSSVENKSKRTKFHGKDTSRNDEDKYFQNRFARYDRNNTRSRTKRNDLDPMDPASYSDIPRGSWSDGLERNSEAKTGVDITASGPLFQMRPYPSPGAVLRANAKSKTHDSP